MTTPHEIQKAAPIAKRQFFDAVAALRKHRCYQQSSIEECLQKEEC